MKQIVTATFLLLFCHFALAEPLAEPLPAPNGPVILNVSGKISNGQTRDSAQFDLAQLKALESRTYRLKTRWSDSYYDYHGPLLTALLDKVGATGQSLHMTALNDYRIEITRSFIDKYQPILAWSQDGQPMSVRDKGPIWLLFPHHDYPELNSETNTGKMIWQLQRIEIR